MGELEYLGGHPSLLKAGTVVIRAIGPDLHLSTGRSKVGIPGQAISGVRLERNYRRSGGGAVGGAIIGSLLLPGVGTLVGAGVGGRRRDDSVIILTAQIDGLTSEIVFAGKDVQKQYAAVAATVQRARSYWSVRLSQVLANIQRAQQLDEKAAARLEPPSAVAPLMLATLDVEPLVERSRALSADAKARGRFVEARRALIQVAGEYRNAVEMGAAAGAGLTTAIALPQVTVLNSPLAQQQALVTIESAQSADMQALAKCLRSVQRYENRLTREERRVPSRRATAAQRGQVVEARLGQRHREIRSQNKLVRATLLTGWVLWWWVGMRVSLGRRWWARTRLSRLNRKIAKLRGEQLATLHEQRDALNTSIRSRSEELSAIASRDP